MTQFKNFQITVRTHEYVSCEYIENKIVKQLDYERIVDNGKIYYFDSFNSLLPTDSKLAKALEKQYQKQINNLNDTNKKS